MRRDGRIKNKGSKAISDKIIMYSIMGVAILTVILVGLMIYSKNLSDDVKEGTMTLEQMANIAGNNTENTESASTEIGKSVEESKMKLIIQQMKQRMVQILLKIILLQIV